MCTAVWAKPRGTAESRRSGSAGEPESAAWPGPAQVRGVVWWWAGLGSGALGAGLPVPESRAGDPAERGETLMASGEPPGGDRAVPRPLHSAQAVDVASASSFRAFEMLHLHLDLRAEFGPPGPGPGSRGLSGTAVLELRCLVPEGASELRLDSHPCLEVAAAALRRERPGSEAPAEPVPFHTRPFSRYGQALCVGFPQPRPAGERFQLLLTYRVGEGPGVSAQPAPGKEGPGTPARAASPAPAFPARRPSFPLVAADRSGRRAFQPAALAPPATAGPRPDCSPFLSAHTAVPGFHFCGPSDLILRGFLDEELVIN